MKVVTRGSTKSYDRFLMMDGNREFKKHRSITLQTAIKTHNLLPLFPIICVKDNDGCLRVVDGQHRLDAAKDLGLEVHYVIATDITHADMRLINTNQTQWQSSDYLKHYVNLGNTEYERLRAFMEASGIPLMLSVALLAGAPTTCAQLTATFKDGRFKVKNMKLALSVSDIVSTLYAHGFKHARARQWVLAIARILATGRMDLERFNRKSAAMASVFTSAATWQQAARQFSDAYDYRSPLTDRHDLFNGVEEIERSIKIAREQTRKPRNK